MPRDKKFLEGELRYVNGKTTVEGFLKSLATEIVKQNWIPFKRSEENPYWGFDFKRELVLTRSFSAENIRLIKRVYNEHIGEYEPETDAQGELVVIPWTSYQVYNNTILGVGDTTLGTNIGDHVYVQVNYEGEEFQRATFHNTVLPNGSVRNIVQLKSRPKGEVFLYENQIDLITGEMLHQQGDKQVFKFARAPITDVKNGDNSLVIYADGIEIPKNDYTVDYFNGVLILNTPSTSNITADYGVRTPHRISYGISNDMSTAVVPIPQEKYQMIGDKIVDMTETGELQDLDVVIDVDYYWTLHYPRKVEDIKDRVILKTSVDVSPVKNRDILKPFYWELKREGDNLASTTNLTGIQSRFGSTLREDLQPNEELSFDLNVYIPNNGIVYTEDIQNEEYNLTIQEYNPSLGDIVFNLNSVDYTVSLDSDTKEIYEVLTKISNVINPSSLYQIDITGDSISITPVNIGLALQNNSIDTDPGIEATVDNENNMIIVGSRAIETGIMDLEIKGKTYEISLDFNTHTSPALVADKIRADLEEQFLLDDVHVNVSVSNEIVSFSNKMDISMTETLVPTTATGVGFTVDEIKNTITITSPASDDGILELNVNTESLIIPISSSMNEIQDVSLQIQNVINNSDLGIKAIVDGEDQAVVNVYNEIGYFNQMLKRDIDSDYYKLHESLSSEWAKWSWYREESFSEGVVFQEWLPIEYYMNFTREYCNVVIEGDAGADVPPYKNNLHSYAYVGALESYENSVDDLENNFAMTVGSDQFADVLPEKGLTPYVVTDSNLNAYEDMTYRHTTPAFGGRRYRQRFFYEYTIPLPQYKSIERVIREGTSDSILNPYTNGSFDEDTKTWVVTYEHTTSVRYSYQGVPRRSYLDIVNFFGEFEESEGMASTWGLRTGTGVTDIVMEKSGSNLPYQAHYPAFYTTPEFMDKHFISTSAYTKSNHFAPITVVHNTDRERGKMQSVLIGDRSSIFHLDELVSNQDQYDYRGALMNNEGAVTDRNGNPNFSKEKKWIMFNINSPYWFGNNSGNIFYGLAIRKS